MNTARALSIAILMRTAIAVAGATPGATTFFECDFESASERKLFTLCPSASFQHQDDETFLKVSATSRQANNTSSIQLDLAPYGGKMIAVSARVKADEVSEPDQRWNGVKLMLHFETESKGKEWPGANIDSGSFDWKTISFTTILPEDISAATLNLGLQDSTGTVCFDDIRMVVTKRQRIQRPPPGSFTQKAFKGHPLPRLRGAMTGSKLEEEDIRTFAQDWGGNLLRFQINRNWHASNDNRDLAEYNLWIDSQLDLLERVLPLCRKYGVYVALDLHALPGGRYTDRSMAMFYEPVYAAAFIEVWEKIARRCKGNPVIWAYDLVNEPVNSRLIPEGMADFWELQTAAARAIRAIEPDKPIIFEVFMWDSPEGFNYVRPVELPNIIYQAHMYEPGRFTHQGISGNPFDLRYPGVIKGREENQATLREYLKPVRDFQLAYNQHIYLGEFSAARWAPGAERYLSDVIEIFEEYGWDWSYHAYREAQCWSLEHTEDKNKTELAREPTQRLQIIKKWFSQNKKAFQ
ncbi:MAG: cellulase family glycosylhydrolase [Kiritimatiellia bacterium]